MNEVLNYCKSILKEKGIEVPLESSNEDFDNMHFNSIEKKILINEKHLISNSKKYNAPLLSYVRVIFYHELGHVFDNHLNHFNTENNQCYEILMADPFGVDFDDIFSRINKNSMQAEINAWDNAKKMIEPDLTNLFYRIKKESLKRHKEILRLKKQSMRLKIDITKLSMESGID